MAVSRVEAMLLLTLELGPIDVGCPVPRRYYELISTERGLLTPIIEDIPPLVITLTATTILVNGRRSPSSTSPSPGLSMAFKLLGIAVDRMTVSAEEDVLDVLISTVTAHPLGPGLDSADERAETAVTVAELLALAKQLSASDCKALKKKL